MPSKSHPRLLVSVRDANEARIAVCAGCDLLDLKEPARGSLGMVEDPVMREVLASDFSIPVSVALGELSHWLIRDEVPHLPQNITYAKLGLSGMRDLSGWVSRWCDLRERIQNNCNGELHWIAVVYADVLASHAPCPDEIIDAAAETGCAGVLFDTFDKTRGNLLKHLSIQELELWKERIHSLKMLCALAGSLDEASLDLVLPLYPDVIAVRGAVCEGQSRTGHLSAESIAHLRERIRAPVASC